MDLNNTCHQELNQEKPQRNFKGIWIPREVWLHPNLNTQQKCLLAEIVSLEGDEGCYASNEYFMNFFKCSKEKIQKDLQVLKKEKLIWIDRMTGRMRFIKTVHPRGVKNYTPEVSKITPPYNNKVYNKEISSKEDIKKNARTSIEKKKKRATHVDTTDSEHQKLEEKYGKEKRDWCYSRLSEWKQDKPMRQWTKNDYRTILRWVIDAYDEEQIKKKKRNRLGAEEKNKETAHKIVNNFKTLASQRQIRIDVNMTAIAFVFLDSQKDPIIIKYSENGFAEQVNNIMRKYKLI